MLADAQIERYSRQIILPQIGGRGQEQLLAASVAIIGADHHAAIAAHYLAAAGVGMVRADVAIAAALADVNPDCRFQALATDIEGHGAAPLVRTHDVVVDASSRDAISMHLNAAAITLRKSLIWARVFGSVGELAIFAGHGSETACFECPRAAAPPSPIDGDVLAGTTAAFIGAALATEAIKAVLGLDAPLTGRMLRYDALDATLHDVAVMKDPACPRCSSEARTRGAIR